MIQPGQLFLTKRAVFFYQLQCSPLFQRKAVATEKIIHSHMDISGGLSQKVAQCIFQFHVDSLSSKPHAVDIKLN